MEQRVILKKMPPKTPQSLFFELVVMKFILASRLRSLSTTLGPQTLPDAWRTSTRDFRELLTELAILMGW